MQTSDKDREIEIKIKCPLCKTEEKITIKTREIMENPAGIMRIPLEHNNPVPHILVLDIDASGFIRSAYLIKRFIDIKNIPVRDTIAAIGTKNFARIIGWILGGNTVVFRGSDQSLIRNLKAILTFIFGEKTLESGKSKVLVDPFNVSELPYSVDILERNIGYALRSIVKDDALMSYIKSEVNKYSEGLKKLMDIMASVKGRINFNKLKQKMGSNLEDHELKFLIAILTFIDPGARKKIDMPEVRITDLF